jgi:hypothetical protein
MALVEVPLHPYNLPLAAGYLQAYAQQDPRIAVGYSFTMHSRSVHHRTGELLGLDCDVHAMSCYLWNISRVSDMLETLVSARVEIQFIFTVDLPACPWGNLDGVRELPVPRPGDTDESTFVHIGDRGGRKMPYPQQRSLAHNASCCQAMTNRIRDILPKWSGAARPTMAGR